MRNGKRLGAVAVALVLAVALADAVGAADYTVGQFVQELARAKNLRAGDAQDAMRSLQATGVALPANLDVNAVLTEDAVARISVAMGLNVRTARPGAAFTADQVDRYFAAFQRELGTTSARSTGTGTGAGVRSGASDEGKLGWGWWSWWAGWSGFGQGGGEGGNEGGNGEGHGKGKGKGGGTPSDPA